MAVDLSPTPLYRRSLVATGYDLLNAVLWLPTGSDRLRWLLVESLSLRPGQTVLEPGCGTGLLTRHLVAAGAEVVAIDGAPAMLAAARRRAPGARYIEGDVVEVLSGGDHRAVASASLRAVVLAFILHELDPARRVELLAAAAGALGPDGVVAVLEWGRPARPATARWWRRVVRIIEPAVAHDMIDGGLDRALTGAGLETTLDRPLVGGRARLVHAVPAPARG